MKNQVKINRCNPFFLWIMASRPRTLTAGLAPVILGAAIAHETAFNPTITFFALMSCLLLQIGTNLANDYFDAVNGIDQAGRLGPTRVTQAGLIAPEKVRAAFRICFGTAAVFGIPMVLRGGLPILAIGVVSVAGAYFYTGGPFPLAYAGLGEVLAFIFFGLIATGGTYYLNTLTLSANALIGGAGLGAIAALLMSVNNLRDINTDRTAGKKTMAVLLGEAHARRFCLGLLLFSLAIPPLFWFLNPARPLVILAMAAVLPFAARFRELLTAPVDAGFNGILGAAGQYLLAYGLCFALGMLV